MSMFLPKTLPPAFLRPYSHSALVSRLHQPCFARKFLFQSTVSQVVPISCALRKLSDCSCWEGMSEEKKFSFSQFFEGFRLEAANYYEEQSRAEAEVIIFKRDTEVIMQQTDLRRAILDSKLQSLEKSFRLKLERVMKTRTRLLLGTRRLSFRKFIVDLEKFYAPTMRKVNKTRRDRWMAICSNDHVLFEKLRSCDPTWTSEADVADAMNHIYEKTTNFKHSFKTEDGLVYMDLPEELVTEETKRLARVIAEAAGCIIGFYSGAHVW